MYEDKTPDHILKSLLSRVDQSMDRREGSIIYDIFAPVAHELAKVYADLDTLLRECYVDTAGLDALIIKAAERGIAYRSAQKAVVAAEIVVSSGDICNGDRFLLDNGIGYIFRGAISDDGTVFLLECERAGTVGNLSEGNLIYDGTAAIVQSAKITGIVSSGIEAESLEELRGRYYEKVEAEAFGGNKTAYREFILGLPKVGGCRVDRAGEIDAGTAAQYPNANVFVTVIGENYDMPDTDDLIAIEDAINGSNVSGDAEPGFAPIDHRVLVLSVLREHVYFAVTAELKSGYTAEAVLPRLTEKARETVRAVGEDWAKHGGGTLKKSAVFAAMLNVEGVSDISGLTMKALVTGSNGKNEMLTCNARSYTGRYIPYLSDVTLIIGGGGA